MSGQTLLQRPTRAALRGVWATAPALAAGLIAWAALFHAEIAAAIRVWIDSTAYNHCFLIVPIAIYLAWDRRATIAGSLPRPSPALAAVILPVGLLWLLAERTGIMEGRQLATMTIAEVMLIAALGWPLSRRLMGPLLYLYFLVPFGAFVTPGLQSLTSGFVMHGLNLLDIANYTDGNTIEIAEGKFYIAEACAGLRFLVASVAFGCFYALLVYRSWLRRTAFVLVSVVVPIVANGLRALGIVVLGHALGSAEAAAADHVVYGWVFFSAVLLLLATAGLPLREDLPTKDRRGEPSHTAPAAAGHTLGAVSGCIALAAIFPLLAFVLDARSASALPPPPPQLPLGRCVPAQGSEPDVDTSGPGRLAQQRLVCSDMVVLARVELFSPLAAPGTIIGEQRRLTDMPASADVETRTLKRRGLDWQVLNESEPDRTAAALVWIGNGPASSLRLRLLQAWHSLMGGRARPVLVVLMPATDTSDFGPAGRRRSLMAIGAYLQDQPGLAETLKQLSIPQGS